MSEFSGITTEEILGALFERYIAIQLNLNCWICALYYRMGRKHTWTQRCKSIFILQLFVLKQVRRLKKQKVISILSTKLEDPLKNIPQRNKVSF